MSRLAPVLLVLAFVLGMSASHGSSVTGPTAGVIPIGGIVLWTGTIATIPASWSLCDGTNSTPNLSSSFVKGVASSAENPGTTGGSATASYTPAGTLAWPAGVPTTANPSATFTIVATNLVTTAGSVPACTTFNGTALVNGSNTVNVPNHTHVASWPAGVPALTGSPASIATEPVYYKVAYIQRKS